MCKYMCTYISIYFQHIYAYIFTHFVYFNVYIQTYTYICTYKHIYISIRVYEYIHIYVQIYIQDTPFPALDLQNSTFNLQEQSILIDRSSTGAIPEFLAEQIEPGAFERIGRHTPSPHLIHETGQNSQKSAFWYF